MSNDKIDHGKLFKIVSDMRTAQQEYFKRIGKARKTQNPDDFELAKNVLVVSKQLEAEVDRGILSINQPRLL